jgi:hypothetical protein
MVRPLRCSVVEVSIPAVQRGICDSKHGRSYIHRDSMNAKLNRRTPRILASASGTSEQDLRQGIPRQFPTKACANSCNLQQIGALIPVGMDHLLGKDYRSPVHVRVFFGRPNRAKPSIIGRMKLRLGSDPPPLGKNPGRYIYFWPQGTAQTTHECHHPSAGTGESPQRFKSPKNPKRPKICQKFSKKRAKKVNFSRV